MRGRVGAEGETPLVTRLGAILIFLTASIVHVYPFSFYNPRSFLVRGIPMKDVHDISVAERRGAFRNQPFSMTPYYRPSW